ncbi:unnamed protein product [Trypanosoma congolense IL3000]|uniref:WGS project CAEQ00000000 data, annotated contig 1094 n=1 Tax=Trypanosoma congolense (strain IL3000) TaxID=1068625 RepID=F9W3R2_TRYCI|nr:unnamed protein product [Trypanosoma congolense IL3000]
MVSDNPHEWHEDGTAHKLVMLVRCEVNGRLVCRNRTTSPQVRLELLKKLRAARLRSLTYHVLCSAPEVCAVLLEELVSEIFTFGEAVDTLAKYLERLSRKTEAKRRSMLSQRHAEGRVPTIISNFAPGGPTQELATGRIYKPLIPNFPLVDGFFVVGGKGSKTIVLLQVTKAKEHHTKRTTVREFRHNMGKLFDDWERIEKDYNLEINYIRHVNSGSIKKHQNCASAKDAANDTDLALWDSIHQYQVTLNSDIASEFINRSGDTREVQFTSGR